MKVKAAKLPDNAKKLFSSYGNPDKNKSIINRLRGLTAKLKKNPPECERRNVYSVKGMNATQIRKRMAEWNDPVALGEEIDDQGPDDSDKDPAPDEPGLEDQAADQRPNDRGFDEAPNLPEDDQDDRFQEENNEAELDNAIAGPSNENRMDRNRYLKKGRKIFFIII